MDAETPVVCTVVTLMWLVFNQATRGRPIALTTSKESLFMNNTSVSNSLEA